MAGRGAGKAIDANEVVPVPTGWTRLGDMKVGDELFDETGHICHVTATYDSMPDVAYRLHFSDDATIDCCGDHLWVTWTHAERKAFLRSPYEDTSRFPDNWPAWHLRRLMGRSLPRNTVEQALELAEYGRSARSIEAELNVCRNAIGKHLRARTYIERQPIIYPDSPGPQIRTTQEIVDTLTFGLRNDTNHCIPTCGALQLPDLDLPISPYALGYWLANGSTSDHEVTCGSHDDEVDYPHLMDALELAGYEPILRLPEGKSALIRSHRLGAELRQMGLLNNKMVPASYFRASIFQRLALLRGLMDGDGWADEFKNTVEFSNTNRALADAVFDLATSLGQKPQITEKRATLYGKDCGPCYRVTWRPTIQVFSLRRKANRLTFGGDQSLRNHHRMIVAAERIAPVPMRCLTVSSPNSMYLVGKHIVPDAHG
jgi:hypothetical protein